MGIFRKMSRVIRGADVDFRGQDVGKAGFNSNVVERESLAGAAVDCLGHAELPCRQKAIEMKAGIAHLTGCDSRLLQSWRGSLARGSANESGLPAES